MTTLTEFSDRDQKLIDQYGMDKYKEAKAYCSIVSKEISNGLDRVDERLCKDIAAELNGNTISDDRRKTLVLFVKSNPAYDKYVK